MSRFLSYETRLFRMTRNTVPRTSARVGRAPPSLRGFPAWKKNSLAVVSRAGGERKDANGCPQLDTGCASGTRWEHTSIFTHCQSIFLRAPRVPGTSIPSAVVRVAFLSFSSSQERQRVTTGTSSGLFTNVAVRLGFVAVRRDGSCQVVPDGLPVPTPLRSAQFCCEVGRGHLPGYGLDSWTPGSLRQDAARAAQPCGSSSADD